MCEKDDREGDVILLVLLVICAIDFGVVALIAREGRWRFHILLHGVEAPITSGEDDRLVYDAAGKTFPVHGATVKHRGVAAEETAVLYDPTEPARHLVLTREITEELAQT